MKIYNVEKLSVVQENKDKEKNKNKDISKIPDLEEDNAQLWYENFVLNAQIELANREISDLWYNTLTNGGNA